MLYYPNDGCSPLTLAKSLLVFDELTFYDHTSILIGKLGTVGHQSHMRGYIELLKQEGYSLNVVEPLGGPVENELKTLIDADIQNANYRKSFVRMMRVDPTFLLTKVPNGNYGKYGDGAAYRQRILALKDGDIPASVAELEAFVPTDGIPPEINAGIMMALDSFNLNFSAYAAIDNDYQLFGDSVGMDLLLKAKFAANDAMRAADKGISQAVAFSLLENIIPNEAFYHKSITDIARFRNEMHKERERFKERVLELTVELQDLSGANKQQKIKEILYKTMVPEVRNFQNLTAKNWDTFFKESTKAVIYDADTITKQVTAVLPLSIPGALLIAAASIGKSVVPHLVDYLANKKELNRINPYAYLTKFK